MCVIGVRYSLKEEKVDRRYCDVMAISLLLLLLLMLLIADANVSALAAVRAQLADMEAGGQKQARDVRNIAAPISVSGQGSELAARIRELCGRG